MLDHDRLAVRADPCRTLRPESADIVEPLFEHCPKSAGPRVLRRADLIRQSEISEQRYRLRPLRRETAVRKPHEQIQHGWRRGEQFDGFKIVRNRMVDDQLLVELVAQHDDVLELRRQGSLIGMLRLYQICASRMKLKRQR